MPQPAASAFPSSNTADHALINEIMVGSDSNSGYAFLELYNPTQNPVDLTGWTIKKKTSSGTQSSFVVSDRLKNKIILPGKYLLLAREGYGGSVAPDVTWPSSYSLARTNNSIIIYDKSGQKVEEISWVLILSNQSYQRDSWSGIAFHAQANPSPQNSQSP